MRFVPTAIDGAFLIEPEPASDARGLFARTFCAETFAGKGLAAHFPQHSTSFNPQRGTLRGLHYQDAPKGEAKLVRATSGRIFDVAVDLRRDSPSYLAHVGAELDAERRNAFYIPEGCAHGFLTLREDCEILYLVSETYAPDLARTVRWDDPAFAVAWPATPTLISPRDATAEDFIP
ncbi:dTDP-4-dehydrorhamnose 3,5-epimerase [Aurantimonas sp. 22II-16-19i]|uniref:dTDP-4-dehydrorhamnose 3,5-epimerase n=1 Tax=Aurantimonas sp. 22II-16-19i TaxID=1317114 RepID=UPI0009F7B4EA|nr:dTDP-4-dehydrorhamnose 3,5-epimerase [Aurantimonas sp. 22II-16-19i]ORE89937.1 dTDP-4-dehydrorhamnose 3,5-epimerase [Aurantimonas sp. 22II-16-19i]